MVFKVTTESFMTELIVYLAVSIVPSAIFYKRLVGDGPAIDSDLFTAVLLGLYWPISMPAYMLMILVKYIYGKL